MQRLAPRRTRRATSRPSSPLPWLLFLCAAGVAVYFAWPQIQATWKAKGPTDLPSKQAANLLPDPDRVTEGNAEKLIADLDAAIQQQRIVTGALARAPDPSGGWDSGDIASVESETRAAWTSIASARRAWMQRDMSVVRWQVGQAVQHLEASRRYSVKLRAAFETTAHWLKVETWDTHSSGVPYLSDEIRESKVPQVRPHLDAIEQIEDRLRSLHANWKGAVAADNQAQARRAISEWLDVLEQGLAHHQAAQDAAGGER